MSEKSSLNVSHNSNLGKIEISPEVIEVITGLAAAEVMGISAMRGSFASDVVERFGKKSHSKGVKVELTETGIIIDLFVELNYGVSIPKVAEEAQTKVRQTINNMTALKIDEINVHVVGIQMDQESSENNIE